MEGHAETEERREEYFGEVAPREQHKSPRWGGVNHAQPQREDQEEDSNPCAPVNMEITWIK